MNLPFLKSNSFSSFGTVELPPSGEGDFFDLGENAQAMYVGATIPFRRVKIFSALLAAVMLLFTVRAFSLQVLSGYRYRVLAESNHLRLIRVPAYRGILFDKDGAALVGNAPSFSVSLLGADLPKDEAERSAILGKLEEFGVSREDWDEALRAAKEHPVESVTITDRLAYDQAIMLSVLAPSIPGIDVQVSTKRHYAPGGPALESLAHVLGYVGRISDEEYKKRKPDGYHLNDRLGKNGLEAAFEKVLRGTTGFRQIEVDALGRERRIIATEKPASGTNLRLSLSLAAQAELERLLAAELKKIGKRRASAIALDPRNGKIIALVSLPGYDANLFAGGILSEDYKRLTTDPDRPLYPRAVSGQFPSGSTFKPVVAVAALAEGIINPKTAFLSTGGIRFYQWFFPDWKAGGHGVTNVRKAIAQSVNTFFYVIGGGRDGFEGLGPDKIAEYGKRFGMGEKLGIDLPGEGSGLLPTPAWKKETRNEEWYLGDSYHMAIGQGDVLVTPLQIATMTAAIANGGTVWKPMLVDALYDAPTASWKPEEPKKIRENPDIASAIATVQDGMRAAVTEGSARALSTLRTPAAGKTGTAEWAKGKAPHAWFTGYAPYQSPEIVVTVLIEEGVEGSRVAVPVARQFLAWYFKEKPVEKPQSFSTSTPLDAAERR